MEKDNDWWYWSWAIIFIYISSNDGYSTWSQGVGGVTSQGTSEAWMEDLGQ